MYTRVQSPLKVHWIQLKVTGSAGLFGNEGVFGDVTAEPWYCNLKFLLLRSPERLLLILENLILGLVATFMPVINLLDDATI